MNFDDEKGKSGRIMEELKSSWLGYLILLAIIIGFIFIALSGKIGSGIKNKIGNNFTKPQLPGSSSTVSEVDPDLVCLVYSEANGYSSDVQQGVASVVFNRVKDVRFPSTIHDVVFQTSQFESVYTGTLVPYDSIPDTEKQLVENAIKKAQSVDNTGGALFYYKPGQVEPSEDQWIRNMDGVTVVDNVVFMTTYPY